MLPKLLRILKKHALPIAVLLLMIILISLYHEIMTPFVIALIVVYLIEPMVTGMNKLHIGKFHLPRGLAVLIAYLVFLMAMVGVGFAFIPSLTAEISQAAEELPRYFSQVRTESIPQVSQRIDEILFRLSMRNKEDVEDAVTQASKDANAAFQKAITDVDQRILPNVDTSGTKPLLVDSDRSSRKKGKKDNTPTVVPNTTNQTVLFTLHPTASGDFEVLAGDREILIEAGENGSFIVKPRPEDANKTTSSFNLEKEINKAAIEFFESSTKYAGSALSVLQDVISAIVNTFVQFILVFMLAAFISIDAPKIMNSIRDMFRTRDGRSDAYDEFKNRLTRGLSGVVRGQIIICCINGTLTGIGLAIFGVNFALLLGIIAGVLSIVPIFGTIISTVPAVLLGLVQGPGTGVLVLLWILLVHFLDTNFFTPKIVGSSSNLHPVIIIFALLAGQLSAGVLGLILAVPIASMLQTSLGFALEKARKNRDPSDITLPGTASAQDIKQSGILAAIDPSLRQSAVFNAVDVKKSGTQNAIDLKKLSGTQTAVDVKKPSGTEKSVDRDATKHDASRDITRPSARTQFAAQRPNFDDLPNTPQNTP